MALLLAKRVTILAEYLNFADVFLEKSANKLPKQIRASEHAIKLEEGKQLHYGPIYSLRPFEFKIFKIYIKTNLANSFIWASKLPVNAPDLFIRKPNSSFCLCIDYQRLNKLIIKKWYPLPLIDEFLNWLSRAKQFIQLDLISAYHWMRIKENNK